jgi:hypothetical protein
MNANDMFPSNWLKASDVPDDDMILTIKSLAKEEIGTDTKWVVYFDEVEKGLVLNKTNNDTIIGLHGQETDGWIGKTIALFATEVAFQGKQTMALRIRMRQPKIISKAGTPPEKNSNAVVTAFWLYANEIKMSQKDALVLVAEQDNDFGKALFVLKGQPA